MGANVACYGRIRKLCGVVPVLQSNVPGDLPCRVCDMAQWRNW